MQCSLTPRPSPLTTHHSPLTIRGQDGRATCPIPTPNRRYTIGPFLPVIDQTTVYTPHFPRDHTAPPWHTLSVDEVFRLLESRPDGLTRSEAGARLQEAGQNVVAAASRRLSVRALVLARFRNVSMLTLLAALALSVYSGYRVEPAMIGVILCCSMALGFVQEYRAERAMESLEALTIPQATVLREGQVQTVPARELVPGDVVRLQAGDRIPADLRWVDVTQLKVNETCLTGESVATEKTAAALTDRGGIPSLADRPNLGFAGTTVTCGRGVGIVFSTGMRTELGRMAGRLRNTESRQTALGKYLDRVVNSLTILTLLMVALIVAVGIFRGEPLHDMLLFGAALAVAVTPEALPATATVLLALGARRMLGHHVLIRRLAAVETLGLGSVICVNKTGILTRNEMTVRKLWAAGETVSVSGVGYDPVGRLLKQGQAIAPGPVLTELLQAAVLCNDADLVRIRSNQWQIRGDATEGALVVAALKAGLVPVKLRACWSRIGEIPFSPESRQMTTLQVGPDGQSLLCSKGAVEVVLAACSTWQGGAGEEALDEDTRVAINAQAESMAADSLQVLAVAHRSGASLTDAGQSLCFLGLIGLLNPPRPESAEAVARCSQAGIKVVMVTGDHPATARAVARELGILRKGVLITGAELSALDDTDFQAAVDHIEVYARVVPAHKLRIVRMLQRQGQVVAMTGSGVNDAPALRQADVGMAVAIGGTDAAREAADVLLTDDRFASIVTAVGEGRGIISTVRKCLMYLLSCSIGQMGLLIATMALGLPLPLNAAEVLYLNLVAVGVLAAGLAVAPGKDTLMRQAPGNPDETLFTRPVIGRVLAGGLWSALASLAVFAGVFYNGHPLAEATTLSVVTLTLMQLLNAYRLASYQTPSSGTRWPVAD